MTTPPPDGPDAGPDDLDGTVTWRQLQARGRAPAGRRRRRVGRRRRPLASSSGRRVRGRRLRARPRRAGHRAGRWRGFDRHGRAPAARASRCSTCSAVGLPHPRPAGRPAGADPPARDRGGGRLGPGRARPAARLDRPAGRGAPAGRSTSAPARGPSRCRSPPSAADVEVWATDVSPDALDVAGANLAGLGRPPRRVRLAEGSWFEALPAELRGARRPRRQQPALRARPTTPSRPRSPTGSRPARSCPARPGSRRCCPLVERGPGVAGAGPGRSWSSWRPVRPSRWPTRRGAAGFAEVRVGDATSAGRATGRVVARHRA